MRVRLSPAADRDLDLATASYRRIGGSELAHEFLNSVEGALESLGAAPGLGSTLDRPPRSPAAGLRRWRVARPFEVHQIFYVERVDTVDVVRILHAARDPRELERPSEG